MTNIFDSTDLSLFENVLFESINGYSIDSISFANNIIACGQSRKEVSL